MNCARHILAPVTVLSIALLACGPLAGLSTANGHTVGLAPGALPWPTDAGDSGQATDDAWIESWRADQGFLVGENARWPTDIPSDIPPLEGTIRDVMVTPGIGYQIDYTSVPNVNQWLASLEGLGFELQYFVYSAPSIPDEETAKRIAAGEWDGVDIAKAPYSMRLDEGGYRLQIWNADFMTPGPPPQLSPTPMLWPPELPSYLSQPASCRLTDLTRLGSPPGGYSIWMTCTDPQVQQHYFESLLAAGLEETERLVSDANEVVFIQLQDSRYAVEVNGVVDDSLVVTIWPISP